MTSQVFIAELNFLMFTTCKQVAMVGDNLVIVTVNPVFGRFKLCFDKENWDQVIPKNERDNLPLEIGTLSIDGAQTFEEALTSARELIKPLLPNVGFYSCLEVQTPAAFFAHAA